MNDLQKLLALRGLSTFGIADRAGIHRHSVQKTVKGLRQTRHCQEAVAAELGLPVEQLFGPESKKALRQLIKQEIDARAAEERKRLRWRFLQSNDAPRILHKRRSGNV